MISKSRVTAQLKKMMVYALNNNIPIIESATENLLTTFIDNAEPHTILEIGTATGYSALTMLAHSPKAMINTIDVNEERIEIAKSNFAAVGATKQINAFCGDALEILPKLTGSYDLIFLDGPKAHYVDLLPHIINVMHNGSVLICDNVGYMGLTRRADELPRDHKHITIARNLKKFVDTITSFRFFKTEVLYEVADGISISMLVMEGNGGHNEIIEKIYPDLGV